jgi:transposase
VLGQSDHHLAADLADFAEQNKDWLRIFQFPTYAPELNPTEGVWSLLKRATARVDVEGDEQGRAGLAGRGHSMDEEAAGIQMARPS